MVKVPQCDPRAYYLVPVKALTPGLYLLRISCESEISIHFSRKIPFQTIYCPHEELLVSQSFHDADVDGDRGRLLIVMYLYSLSGSCGHCKRHRGTCRWHLSLLFPILFFCYLPLFQGKLTPFSPRSGIFLYQTETFAGPWWLWFLFLLWTFLLFCSSPSISQKDVFNQTRKV